MTRQDFELRTLVGEQTGSNQPDVVRLVDCNRKPQPNQQQQPGADRSSGGGGKYRNDENVLVTVPAQYRPIETGEDIPPGEYVTDSGLIVPAVSPELRERLDRAAEAGGVGPERMAELVARAAVDLSVQLFGGAHRWPQSRASPSSPFKPEPVFLRLD